ncbi:MAG: lipocalin family protein [Chitinophaga sp.]|uniref:lipocalin family protein n=1 Tax=Chitinophaga sp. TaxID=1869181 RepID=UPI001B0388D3|nr:lipocalin family protein [Chitinophaga sp.]MBO9732296.1 lipocalin family protein [Chitinophaga sp.]
MTKMKLLAAVACFALVFSGCKKKDKTGDYNRAAIIGKWTFTETYFIVGGQNKPGEPYAQGEYLRFTDNNNLYAGDKNTVAGQERMGYYKIDGSTLTMADNKELTKEPEVWHLDAISNTDITMSMEEEESGIKGKVIVKLKK